MRTTLNYSSLDKFVEFKPTLQIACSAADGQWFNTAAPQIGMQMLIPTLKNKKGK